MTARDPAAHQEDGPSCPGCGLPNYSGLCPVCRGDETAYREELQPFFGPWDEPEPEFDEWENAGRYLPHMLYPTQKKPSRG